MNKPEVRELRAVPRYNVQLPVSLTWREAEVPRPPLHTFTRDISTRGMFVFSDLQLETGSVLEFEIDMAWDEQTPVVVVRGEGRVVRTERPLHGPGGFAVHNLWFRIGEPEEGRALEGGASSQLAQPIASLFAAPRSTRHRGLAVVPRSTPKFTFGSGETK